MKNQVRISILKDLIINHDCEPTALLEDKCEQCSKWSKECLKLTLEDDPDWQYMKDMTKNGMQIF